MTTFAYPMTATVLGDDPQPPTLAVTLRYDTTDPFAVTVDFASKGQWIFARELLIDGALSTAGEGIGDVHVSQNGPEVVVALSSPDGDLTIALPRHLVAAFNNDMLTAVPIGTEWVDLNALIARLEASA